MKNNAYPGLLDFLLYPLSICLLLLDSSLQRFNLNTIGQSCGRVNETEMTNISLPFLVLFDNAGVSV